MPAKLVLLAEPDEDHRDIFRTILEHHGYGVIAADDHAGAVRLARERRPDLVIVAFPLRGEDGRTLTEALRSFEETKRTAVLAVTAEDQPWEARLARDLGATRHCSKPIDPRRIAVQVRDMIGPSLKTTP